MKTLAFLNFKGGTGKTTLSIHLAVAFYEMGFKTVILDMNHGYEDNTYTKEWARQRKHGPMVMHEPEPPPHLLEKLQAQGIELVIMDVPGRSPLANYYAMNEANLVIIPADGSLDYVEDTIGLAKRCNKKAYLLLNNIHATWKRYNRKAQQRLDAINIPTVPITIHNKAEYTNASWENLGVTEYDPMSKVAQEIAMLRAWVMKKFGSSWERERPHNDLALNRICPLESFTA